VSESEIRDLRERLGRVEHYLTAPDGVLPQLASIHGLLEAQAQRLARGDRAFEAAQRSISTLEAGPNRAVRVTDCREIHGAASAWWRVIVPGLIGAVVGSSGWLVSALWAAR
jgi:hypothetical protein